MTKNRTLLTIIFGSIVALSIIAFIAISAASYTGTFAQTATSTSTSTPQVKIIDTASGANFKTTTITVGQTAGASVIKFANGTTKAQTIMLNGVAKVSIPPRESRPLTIGEGTFVYTLQSNSAAKITVVGQ